MAVSVEALAVHLRITDQLGDDIPEGTQTILTANRAWAIRTIQDRTSGAPDDLVDEATVRMVGWVYDTPYAGDRSFGSAWHQSGAAEMLRSYTRRRGIVLDADDLAQVVSGGGSDEAFVEVTARNGQLVFERSSGDEVIVDVLLPDTLPGDRLAASSVSGSALAAESIAPGKLSDEAARALDGVTWAEGDPPALTFQRLRGDAQTLELTGIGSGGGGGGTAGGVQRVVPGMAPYVFRAETFDEAIIARDDQGAVDAVPAYRDLATGQAGQEALRVSIEPALAEGAAGNSWTLVAHPGSGISRRTEIDSVLRRVSVFYRTTDTFADMRHLFENDHRFTTEYRNGADGSELVGAANVWSGPFAGGVDAAVHVWLQDYDDHPDNAIFLHAYGPPYQTRIQTRLNGAWVDQGTWVVSPRQLSDYPGYEPPVTRLSQLAPIWDATTQYRRGDLVSSPGNFSGGNRPVWIARNDNMGSEPAPTLTSGTFLGMDWIPIANLMPRIPFIQEILGVPAFPQSGVGREWVRINETRDGLDYEIAAPNWKSARFYEPGEWCHRTVSGTTTYYLAKSFNNNQQPPNSTYWATLQEVTNSSFTGLSDTPTVLGSAGQQLQVNSGATALEWHTPASAGWQQITHGGSFGGGEFWGGNVGTGLGDIAMDVIGQSAQADTVGTTELRVPSTFREVFCLIGNTINGSNPFYFTRWNPTGVVFQVNGIMWPDAGPRPDFHTPTEVRHFRFSFQMVGGLTDFRVRLGWREGVNQSFLFRCLWR